MISRSVCGVRSGLDGTAWTGGIAVSAEEGAAMGTRRPRGPSARGAFRV